MKGGLRIDHDQVHTIVWAHHRHRGRECSGLLPGFAGLGFGESAFRTALSVTLLFGSILSLFYGSYTLLFKQPVVMPVRQIETHEDYVEALSFYRRIKILEEDITLGLSQLNRMKRKRNPDERASSTV